jgi:hypothetical protein
LADRRFGSGVRIPLACESSGLRMSPEVRWPQGGPKSPIICPSQTRCGGHRQRGAARPTPSPVRLLSQPGAAGPVRGRATPGLALRRRAHRVDQRVATHSAPPLMRFPERDLLPAAALADRPRQAPPDIVGDAGSSRGRKRARPPLSRAEALCLLRVGSGRGRYFTQDAEKLVSGVQSDMVAAVHQADGSRLGHQPLQTLT